MQKNSYDNYVIYDLDGTLYRGNTFWAFIGFAFLVCFIKLRLKTCFVLLRVCIARLRRRVSHFEMKKEVLLAARAMNSSELTWFGGYIAKRCIKRKKAFENALDAGEIRSGATLYILATAAPLIYAQTIADKLGCESVVASDFEGSQLVETIGETKLKALERIVTQPFLAGATLFTDHRDDIPLAAVCSRVFLIDPSEASLTAFQATPIDVRVLRL